MSPGDFRATPVHADGLVVLALAGDLDVAGLPAFDEAVAYWADTSRLILDLTELTFMDSSGVSALVNLQRRMGSDRTLVLRNLPHQTQRVLEITGVLDAFHVE